jgi:hypothetical protein
MANCLSKTTAKPRQFMEQIFLAVVQNVTGAMI